MDHSDTINILALKYINLKSKVIVELERGGGSGGGGKGQAAGDLCFALILFDWMTVFNDIGFFL